MLSFVNAGVTALPSSASKAYRSMTRAAALRAKGVGDIR